jgi:dolichol-phosphate mannosyltransferase
MIPNDRPCCEVSVILPTYNERENIGPLVEAIFLNTPASTEVIVVDDDSPDGTWQVVEEISRIRENLYLLRRTDKKGLVSAPKDAIALARGEVIVWADCDFSMPPEKIPELLDKVRQGHDAAVGSRFVRGGGVEIITESNDTLLAYLMSLTLNRFLQLFLGSGFKDYTSGFIAIRKKVLEAISLRGDYGEYFVDLVYRTLRSGYKVIETPYLCRGRTAGVSKTGTHFFDYIRRGRKYVWLALQLKFAKSDYKGPA